MGLIYIHFFLYKLKKITMITVFLRLMSPNLWTEKIEAHRDKEYWEGSYCKSSNIFSAVPWNFNKTIKITILHFFINLSFYLIQNIVQKSFIADLGTWKFLLIQLVFAICDQ